MGDARAMLFSNATAPSATPPCAVDSGAHAAVHHRDVHVHHRDVHIELARVEHGGRARHVHWAHAAVVGMHTVCCGLPILGAMAASGVGLGLLGGLTLIHDALHHYEIWIVAASGALVALGGYLEWRLRRSGVRRTPWLFLMSAAAFFVNAAVVAAHAQSSGHDHAHHHAHAITASAPVSASAGETTAPSPPSTATPASDAAHHDHHHP